MRRQPPRFTRTETPFPYTKLFRLFLESGFVGFGLGRGSAPFALPPDRAIPALAIDEAALAEVVRRHFDAHGIADDRPDAETPHPASRIDDYAMAVFEHDAESRVGQDFVDHAIEGQDFLLGQISGLLEVDRRDLAVAAGFQDRKSTRLN